MTNVVLNRLNERAKELNCLYQLFELLSNKNNSLNFVFRQLIKIIPPAWQYPSVCCVRITYDGEVYKSDEFLETIWVQSADIVVDDILCGKIEVFYMQYIRDHGGSQFLPEEQKLLNTIALRLSEFIFSMKLQKSIEILKKRGYYTEGEFYLSDVDSDLKEPHWIWRYKMAELYVAKLNRNDTGVVAVYLIGSTKNAIAGPKSDIDLLVHFRGNEEQRKVLLAYTRGWSYALAELNYEKTGFKTDDGLIDLHLITDEDIQKKTSYAVMINSLDNQARLIPFKD